MKSYSGPFPWQHVMSLDRRRKLVDGDPEELRRAIRAGADLRIYSEFFFDEHINTDSPNHELIQESFALVGVEFQRMRFRHGLCAAMFAGQAACLGHLPVDQHWILGKVLSHAAHIWLVLGDPHDVPLSA